MIHKKIDIEEYEYIDEQKPNKIWVCHCKQCSLSKASRKNRKYKKAVKRMLNKKRRTGKGCGIVHYWA